MAATKLQEISSTIILNNVKTEISTKIKDDILLVSKNSSDEIITIDYDLAKAYELLNAVVANIQESITIIESGDVSSYVDEEFLLNKNHGLIVFIPTFNIFNNVFLANIGPRIPAKILFIGNVTATIETKVTNYGMNNGLLEVYLKVSLLNTIVLPNTKTNAELNIDLLIGAKSIQGRVPFQYTENLDKISIPLN